MDYKEILDLCDTCGCGSEEEKTEEDTEIEEENTEETIE